MAKLIAIVFHLLMVLHYGYSIKVYLLDLKPPEFMKKVNDIFGGPFKFLTFWDMLVQFLYFVVAFSNDLFGSSVLDRKRQSLLQKFRDFSFATVVFFLGSMVSIVFWLLFNLNRDLIFPELFDAWFPSWLNHAIHTMPCDWRRGGVGSRAALVSLEESWLRDGGRCVFPLPRLGQLHRIPHGLLGIPYPGNVTDGRSRPFHRRL
ncbi:androgen-dependent TFPI-regulating protein-like [Penaeus chinensis]|uniref:androgen-dependent TFPI-regulating protein-like n=1 Tax=Penaeus chinensis TaxID=139456 RepID=UPI001FB833B7|nr:androgen-dependent TFPI-regulating protein-like [Penaeus chinensis]